MFYFFFVFVFNNAFSQQNDTSDYFPLGLWGIVRYEHLPLNHSWVMEVQKWQDLKANYIINDISSSYENTVRNVINNTNILMDIQNTNEHDNVTDSSLIYWVKDTIRFSKLSDSIAWQNFIRDTILPLLINKCNNKVKTFLIAHEAPAFNKMKNSWDYTTLNIFWPRLRWLTNYLHFIKPNIKVVICASVHNFLPNFENYHSSLDCFLVDLYCWNGQSPNYIVQQQNIDFLMTDLPNFTEHLKFKNTEWQGIIQSHGEYDAVPIESNCTINRLLRRPSYLEMRCQSYIYLALGARGIIAYSYNDNNRQREKNYEAILGIIDSNRNDYNFCGENEYNNLKLLYSELDSIGKIIKKLRYYGYVKYQNGVPNNNIVGITSVSDTLLIIGTFKRRISNNDSINYIIPVNRVIFDCNGILSNRTTSISFSVNCLLYNEKTEEIIRASRYNNINNFILNFQPGEGKILRIKNVSEGYSGNIVLNTTWDGIILVKDDIIIDTNVTLTIKPGTKLFFVAGKKIICRGTLLAQGTNYNNITFTSLNTNEFWGGITFVGTGASNSIIQNCKIERVNNNGSAVNVINAGNGITISYSDISNLGNVNNAIYVNNSYIYVFKNKFENNNSAIRCFNIATAECGSSVIFNNIDNGNNKISLNLVGISAEYNSTIYMELGQPNGAYNSINYCSMNAFASNNSII